jgi:hypothetical protein
MEDEWHKRNLQHHTDGQDVDVEAVQLVPQFEWITIHRCAPHWTPAVKYAASQLSIRLSMLAAPGRTSLPTLKSNNVEAFEALRFAAHRISSNQA